MVKVAPSLVEANLDEVAALSLKRSWRIRWGIPVFGIYYRSGVHTPEFNRLVPHPNNREWVTPLTLHWQYAYTNSASVSKKIRGQLKERNDTIVF